MEKGLLTLPPVSSWSFRFVYSQPKLRHPQISAVSKLQTEVLCLQHVRASFSKPQFIKTRITDLCNSNPCPHACFVLYAKILLLPQDLQCQ